MRDLDTCRHCTDFYFMGSTQTLCRCIHMDTSCILVDDFKKRPLIIYGIFALPQECNLIDRQFLVQKKIQPKTRTWRCMTACQGCTRLHTPNKLSGLSPKKDDLVCGLDFENRLTKEHWHWTVVPTQCPRMMEQIILNQTLTVD